MARTKRIDLSNPAALRKKVGINQSAFWSRFGVTQSGGSRYEGGRDIPTPIKLLMALHAVGKITDEDLEDARKAIS